MRTNLRTRAALATAVPLIAVGLAGCGGNDDTESAASGTTPTAEASESPSEMADTSDGSDPTALFADMLAAMKDKGTATVAMDLGTSGNAKGQIDFASESPAMSLTMSMSGMGGMEMRLVDGTMYMSMSPLTPTGKFVKLDDSIPGMDQLSKSMDSMTQFTPEKSTEMMRDSLKSLKEVGTTDIDGESTTHYKVTVDASKSMKELELPTGSAAQVPKVVKYDMFVTSDSLLRRVQVNSMGQSITIDYTDWGAPVTIEAPKASDLVELPGT
ncbi:MAG: LppX_LprAFG lipoprotein [Nocardioidaceae bacterium]